MRVSLQTHPARSKAAAHLGCAYKLKQYMQSDSNNSLDEISAVLVAPKEKTVHNTGKNQKQPFYL